MTLDDLIDALEALRVRYPAAGAATVDCPMEFEPCYEQGEVQLGFVFLVDEEDEDDDERQARLRARDAQRRVH